MVTTAASFADARHRTPAGQGYDGVVRVSYGGYFGTGSLLFDGRAILTTAHLFEGRTSAASVTFETRDGTQTLGVSRILLHPGYDGPSNLNNDLALLWLERTAPAMADRYDIYRNGDEIGRAFTLIGYGSTGTGSTGEAGAGTFAPLRLKAQNRFDADTVALNVLGLAWVPQPGSQLVADFDNGMAANDALGRLIGRSDRGQGLHEGLIAPGDSGGPAFIQGQVAGVASYGASLSLGSTDPDIDNRLNSSFGEIAAWQRVSHYQQWIDQSMRAQYTDAPTRPEEVKKEVIEGQSGTSYAYFLLQFTGVRSDPNQILSVDYATRDGTARAGSDYLAVSGRLNLYPNENQAVIAVEIIGERTPEPREQFYLDVFNPVGGSFGDGVVKLTAVRTILDDDGWMG